MNEILIAKTPEVRIGGARPLLIAGPCAIEDEQTPVAVASVLREIAARLDMPFVFKASYDKANRTSLDSFRGIGFQKALAVLDRVRREVGVPVLTDVHEPGQVRPVAEVADVLQVPAFLCRQTDLLLAAGGSGRVVNLKKGQFMAPEDMRYAVEKVLSAGSEGVFLTERGTSFGYHDLVVDMRALPAMRRIAPVVFDITHSVQTPGGLGGATGGRREFAPTLARAAAGAGVDGFFVETHPDPRLALSDGPNMIPLVDLEELLAGVVAVWEAARAHTGNGDR